MKFNRIKELEEYIKLNKSVTNEQLIEKFNISMPTLRRDLNEVTNHNDFKKVYGGVVYTGSQETIKEITPIKLRQVSLIAEKQRIGSLAAELVADGDTIFLDSGTTTPYIVDYLKDKHVTIVTHSIDVIELVRCYDKLECICLGGKLRRENNSFYSNNENIPYNFDIAFIATVGISRPGGLSNLDFYDGLVKKNALAQANKVCLVADHSKFGITAYNRFSEFDNLDIIITDEEPQDEFLKICRKHQIKLIY